MYLAPNTHLQQQNKLKKKKNTLTNMQTLSKKKIIKTFVI